MEFFKELIKKEVLIRVSRVEKSLKIDKRASPFIRKVRVSIKSILSNMKISSDIWLNAVVKTSEGYG